MTEDRLSHLNQLMSIAEFEVLALNPGSTLTYLTGLSFHLSERPTLLLYKPPDTLMLILPELEQNKARSSHLPLQCFAYNDNPDTWLETFKTAFQSLSLDSQKIGVEPARLRFLELDFMKRAAPDLQFVTAEKTLDNLRLQKDEHEIDAMRQAVRIAQKALETTLDLIHPGMSEREIASELTIQLLRAGSDAELPFSPIVASGPNSANPHATPSDRRISRGDLLLIDWGAYYQGYCSDLTRTFSIGEVDEEFQNIANVVERANYSARSACAPGVYPETIDTAARDVIVQAGYGNYFTHRTGHGLGMEGHEPPYIHQGAIQPLIPGVTFTIEPGIYLPGRGGVRIEDNIHITKDYAECLSDLPRNLVCIWK